MHKRTMTVLLAGVTSCHATIAAPNNPAGETACSPILAPHYSGAHASDIARSHDVAVTPTGSQGRVGEKGNLVTCSSVATRNQSDSIRPKQFVSDPRLQFVDMGHNIDSRDDVAFQRTMEERARDGDLLAATAESGDAPRRSKAMEEVIVTAQKREERLIDVPTSILVLNGDDLMAQGVSELSDYAKQVPGLVISGSQGPGSGQPVLRGLTSGQDRANMVGIYLDNVPMTRSSPGPLAVGFSFDSDLSDVEQIEVLKGPQSTLYGASAIGGVIRLVTKKLDYDRLEGGVRVDGSDVSGGGTGYSARGSVSIPLVSGSVAVRASGFYREEPGYVRNRIRGDENETRIQGGRLTLQAQLHERVETTFNTFVQKIDAQAPTHVIIDSSSKKPLNGDWEYESLVALPRTSDFSQISNATTVDLGFATLENIASYSDVTDDEYGDFGLLADFGLAGPNGATIIDHNENKTRRVTDELRLTSTPGQFEWMVAGYFDDEKDRNYFPIRGVDASGNILPPSDIGYDVYTYDAHFKFRDYAVFGNVTYQFSQKWEATFGARYNENRQSFTVARSGLLGSVPIPPASASDSQETYLLTVSFSPTQNLTLYARGASGYRPGSVQLLAQSSLDAGVDPIYDPDTLWNYELGAKGTLWDDKVRFALDAYRMDWSDVQLGAAIGGFSVIVNAAEARCRGLEASVEMRPVSGLVARLESAYLETEILDAIPAIGVTFGDPLPNSPKFNAAGLIDYEFGQWGTFTPSIGLTYSYRSSALGALVNGEAFERPSYSTLDIRAGLSWDRYRVIGWIDNVTDEFGLTSLAAGNYSGSPVIGVPIRPRRVGISFEAKF